MASLSVTIRTLTREALYLDVTVVNTRDRDIFVAAVLFSTDNTGVRDRDPALLFAHIFEHIGMNIGLLPITGIPLPFISYGGTFLIMIMSLMGLMQSVWVHRNRMLEEEAAKRPALTPRTAPAIA